MKVEREYLKEFYSAVVLHLKDRGWPKDKYLAKQLKFLGWVEEDSYNKDPEFAYFITNRSLEGKYYIYPERFSDSYKTQKKAKPYDKYIGLIGLPGLTKVEYSLIWR